MSDDPEERDPSDVAGAHGLGCAAALIAGLVFFGGGLAAAMLLFLSDTRGQRLEPRQWVVAGLLLAVAVGGLAAAAPLAIGASRTVSAAAARDAPALRAAVRLIARGALIAGVPGLAVAAVFAGLMAAGHLPAWEPGLAWTVIVFLLPIGLAVAAHRWLVTHR